MYPNKQYEHSSQELMLEEIVADKSFELVIYNDDVNTFEWVIECLIKYCKHTAEQAEQCALLIHYKGKYVVFQGPFQKLEPICVSLCDCGLSAKIE